MEPDYELPLTILRDLVGAFLPLDTRDHVTLSPWQRATLRRARSYLEQREPPPTCPSLLLRHPSCPVYREGSEA